LTSDASASMMKIGRAVTSFAMRAI
jgi:hypothetical protein